MLENIKDELNKFGANVIKQSRANLTRQGKNSSKSLYNSLGFNLKVSKNSFQFEFEMDAHGQFQDKGVSGTKKKYDTPFSYKSKMPPLKAFDKWVIRKGIAPRDKEGKFINRNSLKFLIARKIFTHGIKPSLFFTKPFEKEFEKLPDVLIEKFGLEIDEFLKYTLKELK